MVNGEQKMREEALEIVVFQARMGEIQKFCPENGSF